MQNAHRESVVRTTPTIGHEPYLPVANCRMAANTPAPERWLPPSAGSFFTPPTRERSPSREPRPQGGLILRSQGGLSTPFSQKYLNRSRTAPLRPLMGALRCTRRLSTKRPRCCSTPAGFPAFSTHTNRPARRAEDSDKPCVTKTLALRERGSAGPAQPVFRVPWPSVRRHAEGKHAGARLCRAWHGTQREDLCGSSHL